MNRLAVSADGSDLYVLDAASPDRQGGSRLYRLDAWTGRVMAEHEMPQGGWNLALAHIPEALIPASSLLVRNCQR